MAMTQITTPAAGASDWSDFVDQVEKHRRGYIQVSITEYDTSTVPKIAEGSVVVVAGAVYHCDADTSISGSVSSGNTNYCRMVSGTPTWTTVAPTWSDAQQGWYDATVAYRYLFECYYDGTNYTNKNVYNSRYGERPVQYETIVKEDASTGLAGGTTHDIEVTGFSFTPTAVMDAKIWIWASTVDEHDINDEACGIGLWDNWGRPQDGNPPYIGIVKATPGANKVTVRVAFATAGTYYYRLTVTAVKSP